MTEFTEMNIQRPVDKFKCEGQLGISINLHKEYVFSGMRMDGCHQRRKSMNVPTALKLQWSNKTCLQLPYKQEDHHGEK